MFNKVQPNRKPFIETKPEPQPEPERMTITVDQLAEELHISRPTAYNLVKEKGFPAFSIGKRVLVNRKALQEWLDRQCQLVTEV